MARITFGLDELLKILIANKLLPGEVVRASVKGERIHFVIRTTSFILPFIPASVRFVSFDGNNAMLELTIVSSHLNKARSWFEELLKPKLPKCMELDYPNISVDVNKLLVERGVRGVRVEGISLAGGELTIVTGDV